MREGHVARLSILDTYGVVWPLASFARDLLQNFFDATPDFDAVVVSSDEVAGVLEIRGPAEFDLELLAYLGATTKNDGTTAGGFGEGFKICALVGLRDFGLRVHAGSGETTLEAFLDPVPLGRELCYRIRSAKGAKGSFVRLSGCTEECFAAFRSAKDAFHHPGNAKLGAVITAQDDVSVHVSATSGGELYYRRQLRGSARFYSGTALTFACHVPDDALEGDRDRRDLDPTAVARAVGMRLAPDALYAVILEMQRHWRYGQVALTGLLAAAIERKLTFAWPGRWVSNHTERHGSGLLALAERQGLSIALGDFTRLGMRSLSMAFTDDLETHPPDPTQRARIDALADLYAALAGVERPTKRYGVFDSERAAVLGQHLGDRVIVDARLLVPGRFTEAGATVLHELAHDTGGEDSPAFQARLTRLLRGALENRELVREARVSFARAEPASAPAKLPEIPEPLARYEPVASTFRGSGRVHCTACAPPSFPRGEELMARIEAAARAVEVSVTISYFEVGDDETARRSAVRGVPSVRVAVPGHRAEVLAGRAPIGLRLRTYAGANGLDVLPSEDAIAQAIREISKRPVREPPAPVRDPKAERAARDRTVDWWLSDWCGPKGKERGLAIMWSVGLRAACATLRARIGRDASLDANALFARVTAACHAAGEGARALRRADPDFEADEGFEEAAMGAAQGAYVARFVQPGARGGAAEGERDFRLVREACGALLEIDVAATLRDAALIWPLLGSGFAIGSEEPGVLDRRRFARKAALARQEAASFQAELDAAEARPNAAALLERLHGIGVEGAARKAARDEAERHRVERGVELHRIAARSRALLLTYEQALAGSGSSITATRRLIAHARRGAGKR
jgi:hypothetical protein